MAEGFQKIKRVEKGGVSLVSANYANELIDLLNALGLITISPVANVGTTKIAKNGLIVDLSALDGRLKAVEAALQVTGNAAIENRVTDLESYVVYLNTRMNNASISGSGECSGNNITINVSLNIPG